MLTRRYLQITPWPTPWSSRWSLPWSSPLWECWYVLVPLILFPRRDWRAKKLLTFLLMVPMYFSAGIIPSYLLYQKLHVLDTMWVLILPLIYSPYNMLIMKNYFQSTIPDSLEESAFLDGASNFQILSKIVLPLSKPILATLSLFYAVGVGTLTQTTCTTPRVLTWSWSSTSYISW